jgi:hypothetical protein
MLITVRAQVGSSARVGKPASRCAKYASEGARVAYLLWQDFGPFRVKYRLASGIDFGFASGCFPRGCPMDTGPRA